MFLANGTTEEFTPQKSWGSHVSLDTVVGVLELSVFLWTPLSLHCVLCRFQISRLIPSHLQPALLLRLEVSLKDPSLSQCGCFCGSHCLDTWS